MEVNAHSLFSKWFSESGKRVGALFASIAELCDDPRSLVVVLIDEVEVRRRTQSQFPLPRPDTIIIMI